MADFAQLQRIVREIEEHPHVQDATIVSRSGMHIAGDIPKGAHMETYVAMSAILLGAAESATSELHDRLKFIVVQLDGSKFVLAPAGNKALLVMRSSDEANPDELAELTGNFSERIEKAL
ncbi:MAG TPA: roadblock/LC7 domain-containing protein [Euryarchaeota archaeon]|nr:roadblock/LC7 domain-containing protein [Euryarchaeota archaeon]